MIQQINQGSGNDILYGEKTFIFSAHSAVTCSKDCPWDKSCDTHRVPDRHTDAHHTLTHTTDSFTVKDKWRLTLWPGEMGWLNRSEMKILLTKVPWAKQVVSLGSRDADFCSSRATCQSTHAPNSHTERYQTLQTYGLTINGRKCLGLLWVSLQTIKSQFMHYNVQWMKLLLHIWHSINLELFEPILAFVCWQRVARVQDVTEDF